ncbi:MAG: signal recognition particle receptor subunit alpha, partial [Pseudomonadales bacterium]
MFESLTDGLGTALRTVTGKAQLTEDNIAQALREVRMALLEADVALEVVKDFAERVKARALGHEVAASLSPGQEFIKIVNDELVTVMSAPEGSDLNLNVQPPA